MARARVLALGRRPRNRRLLHAARPAPFQPAARLAAVGHTGGDRHGRQPGRKRTASPGTISKIIATRPISAADQASCGNSCWAAAGLLEYLALLTVFRGFAALRGLLAVVAGWACIYARQSRCGGRTARVREIRRPLAVVEQWLNAPRRQWRRRRPQEGGLLAGLLGAKRVRSGSGLFGGHRSLALVPSGGAPPWREAHQATHGSSRRFSPARVNRPAPGAELIAKTPVTVTAWP